MATNFEFYKDEILKCLSESNVAIKNNKPVKCDGCCNSCIRDSEIGVCMDKPFFEWLCAEHIKQPKLTKRERAFCEAAQTGTIARDKDGKIYWCNGSQDKLTCTWDSNGSGSVDITDFHLFSFIKWEDENPWAVEDLLKLEVMEVQE